MPGSWDAWLADLIWTSDLTLFCDVKLSVDPVWLWTQWGANRTPWDVEYETIPVAYVTVRLQTENYSHTVGNEQHTETHLQAVEWYNTRTILCLCPNPQMVLGMTLNCLHRVIYQRHPGANGLSCWSTLKQQLTLSPNSPNWPLEIKHNIGLVERPACRCSDDLAEWIIYDPTIKIPFNEILAITVWILLLCYLDTYWYSSILICVITQWCHYGNAILVMIRESNILIKLLEHQSEWTRIAKIERNC